ncbi:MAG: NTF2 fold immunity protein [Polyangiaceae bacterium]
MTPEERVRSFMAAMVEWEPRAHTALMSGQRVHEGPIREQLRAIYEEHCSTKGKGAGRFGRNLVGGGQGLSSQPKFDQEVLRVEAGPKKSVSYVITKPRRDQTTLWRFTVTVDAAGKPGIDDLHGIALTKTGELHGEWAKFGY